VTRVVVDVMPPQASHAPQGQAVRGARGRLGFAGIATVRQGKRFEIELDAEPTSEIIAEIERAAGTLLANPVIEDFDVRVEP
jgi:phosphoribosylformylglycinamidine synthase PurS subunit